MKSGYLSILPLLLFITLSTGCSRIPLMDTGRVDSEVRLVPVAKGYAGTSVNAVIFRRNSIVTHDNTQFISFYNADGHLVLGRRKPGGKDWELHTTPYQGNIHDAHNSISIAVDGKGYLHVAWDHHGHPLRYARSREPGGLELGDMEQPGSLSAGHRVTYPEFYHMPDGDLLFMYRHGSAGDGFQVLHHYDLETGTWKMLHEQLIDGLGEVNPYWQTTIDDAGTLHISWNWRRHGGVETNHDLAYARSRDGGKTWERTNGEPYDLPITPASAEYALRIPENSTMMNQTSMDADSHGRPYIVNYWTPEGSDVPQYHIVYHDGEAWRHSQISQLTQPFKLRGGGTMAPPLSRPQIVVDTSDGNDRAIVIFRAEERGGRVSVITSDALDEGEWQTRDLHEMPAGNWEPSFDTELWRHEKKLHLFVQRVGQRDHEQSVDMDPTMVYVLEWHP